MIYILIVLAILMGWIIKGQSKNMSVITDFVAKEQADIDALNAKLDSISTGVAELDTLIKTLQTTATSLTPEDQAALDAVVTQSDALVAKATAIDTTAPVAAPPAA